MLIHSYLTRFFCLWFSDLFSTSVFGQLETTEPNVVVMFASVPRNSTHIAPFIEFIKPYIIFFFFVVVFFVPAKAQSKELPVGFPNFVNTGDLQNDRANYANEKAKWIKNHSEEYIKLGGEQSTIDKLIDAKPTNISEKEAIRIDFNAPHLFKLVAVNVVDINHKHTSEEMRKYQKEGAIEFSKRKISIDWDNNLYYTQNLKNGMISVDKLQREELEKKEGCKNCMSDFEIAVHTENEIRLRYKAQDEGQFFVFEYVFYK